MIHKIEDFLKRGEIFPIIDVRTPAEFEQGHIPRAYNIPLFTNEERAIIGTIYKQDSKENAIMEGLKIVGPKMYDYVKMAKEIAVDNQVLVHCWRGGMRSASMAWLFNTAGLKADTLEGGYKAYRKYIRQSFLREQPIVILGGMTGSNKTDILKELQKLGEQFIDLEGIAHHRGSAFGQIGLEPQPTNEQFENNLAKEWLALDQNKIVWFEDESKALGAVRIVDELFFRIRRSPLVVIEKNRDLRVKHSVDDYAHLDIEELKAALLRIKKRLGGNNVKMALEALDNKDFAKVAELSLIYYDKTYSYGIEERKDIKKLFIPSDIYDPKENAKLIFEKAKGFIVDS